MDFIHLSHNVCKALEPIKHSLFTGLKSLDNVFDLGCGKLVTVGGHSGQGKTSFLLDVALYVSQKMPVYFFSIEMSNRELQQRVLSKLTDINCQRIIKGKISDREKESLNQATKKLGKYQLMFDESSCSIYSSKHLDYLQKMGAKIPKDALNLRLEKIIKEGAKLIVIDYLQLIWYCGKSERKDLEVHAITWQLHEMAKESGVTILIGSQLRRLSQERRAKDTRPTMEDLRNSGTIEQNSNAVLLLYNPSYYQRLEQPICLDSDIVDTDYQIIIGKYRNGQTGVVNVKFKAYNMSFEDLSSNEKF